MVHLSGKITFASVKTFLHDVFPGLGHWFRMPGLLSWAAVSAGTAAASALPYSAGAALPRAVTVAVLVILAAAGVLARRPIVRFGAFLFFALLLCMVRRADQTGVYAFTHEPAAARKSAVTVRGRVVTAPLPSYENFHFLLKVDSCDDGRLRPLRGRTVSCISPSEPPLYGTVMVRGTFSPPEPRRNPFEFDGYSSMMAKGLWGTFDADYCRTLPGKRSPPERLAAAFRGVCIATLRKINDYDNRALLQAVFLGDTEFLSPFIKEIFRVSGTYHLIAISGLNTAMLTGALYFFLSLLRLRKAFIHLVCIAALWAYLPFVGMIPSLFRATVMATCVIVAVFFEKKNYALHTLGLAGTIWFIISPESLFEPGYQLSFAATAGILVLYPVFSRLTPKPANRYLRKVVSFLFSSFHISFVSFLATAPILLYHFGTVSYIGILANLSAVASMTAAMWAFLAGLLCQTVFPPLAALPLWCSERFMDIVVGTGRMVAEYLPWSRMICPVPPVELLVLSAVFLAGLATVKRGLTGRYLTAFLAAAVLAVPSSLLARGASRHVRTVLFTFPKCSLIGIRWPSGDAWAVAPDPVRSLPYLLERHVNPWVRHRTCGARLCALVVPDRFAPDADTLFERDLRAAPERLVTYPSLPVPPGDSLKSIYTPCPGCTCTVIRTAGGARLRIAAPRFDTTLFMTGAVRPAKRKTAGPAAFITRSAVVMAAGSRGIRVREVVPPDHPVR